MWAIAMLALCFYASSLGMLFTDPAKYALNLPIPHPPLGRWVMQVSQLLFGSTIFAVRLPTMLADIGAVALFLRLAQKQGSSSYGLSLFVLLAVFAASPLNLGSGFQTSFLALGLACIATGAFTERISSRVTWISIGYAVALWSQIQGILLLPFVLLVLWQTWKRAGTRHERRNVLAAGVFSLVQTGLVTLWLASNPFALADALDLAGRAPAKEWDRVIAFAGSGLAYVWAMLVVVAVALATRAKRDWRVYGYIGTATLFSFYLYKNPAPYYLPYVIALVLWGVVLGSPWTKRRAMVVFAVSALLLVLDPGYKTLWQARTWAPHRTASQIAELRPYAQSPNVVAVGNFGYEWNYLLGTRFNRFGTSETIQQTAQTAIVFVPETVTEEERRFLKNFTSSTTIGSVVVYTR